MPRDAVDLSPDLQVAGGDGGVANGAHGHVVFNPAGRLFRVACFHDAPGIQTVGEASGEFSWFKGYAWRYDGAQIPPVFFGLIRTMLTERPE